MGGAAASTALERAGSARALGGIRAEPGERPTALRAPVEGNDGHERPLRKASPTRSRSRVL